MKKNIFLRPKEQGAVSLFVVIFTALLLVVITVSFISLMIRDQEEASQADLSQSAYDASQAGTEDAKRLLLIKERCDAGVLSMSTTACQTAAIAKWNNPDCNMVKDGLGLQAITTNGNGTSVQTSISDTSGGSYDQAYTCVQIRLNTDDYQAVLQDNQSIVIPVVVPAGQTYNYIKLEWYNQNDLLAAAGAGGMALAIPGYNAGTPSHPLYAMTNWPSGRPPIMRTQFIQVNSGFKLSDFDSGNASGNADTRTVFLYPQTSGAEVVLDAVDHRKTSPNDLIDAKCSTSLNAGGYACSSVLNLGGNSNRMAAFVRLMAIYGGAHFRLTLYNGNPNSNGSSIVQFNGVEPEIDSTGRAGDLFRRLDSRVVVGNYAFPYPEAAVDVANGLCKDFSITNNPSDFHSANGCSY